MEEDQEEWRPIPGWNHEASNLGRIRSVDRWYKNQGQKKYFRKGCVLKQITKDTGYKLVYLHSMGMRKKRPVHQLVFEAFHGPRDLSLTIDHIDQNKLNNRPDNLQELTRKENSRKGALNQKGLRSYYRDEIQQKHAAGATPQELADEYECGLYYMKKIISDTHDLFEPED